MNEKKLLEQIKDSAEDIRVPDSLKPEMVERKLQERRHAYRRSMIRRIAAAAAAAVVVIGGVGALELSQSREYAGASHGEAVGTERKTEQQKVLEGENAAGRKTKVGDQYYLASDYGEVYDLFEGSQTYIWNEETVVWDSMDAVPGAASMGEAEIANEEDAGYGSNYSDTNTMVEGVDESDIVKINENYLYVRKEDTIDIVDISSGEMKLAGSLDPEIGDADCIHEMYLDRNILYLINSCNQAVLDSGMAVVSEMEAICGSYYYVDANCQTVLQSYDVSDPAHPKKLGSTVQDGSYYTSRKVGDYIYLFSQKYVADPETKEDVIPFINDEKVDADCIYLPRECGYGFEELIVTSVDTKNPDQTVDQMVIVNEYCDIYMSENALYLYSFNYTGEQPATKIAKFSYQDGRMDAVNAALVKGMVMDRFTLHESGGIFQILTTVWSNSSENQLYLFDENLEPLGSLENIAKGEEIYAARYIGDIVYFITYHNTDPLFAVDISDPKNPKALGEIEMTGFSDYLHPYGEDLLLGIGYETDPDTSETLGVKLTMFDISDPANLKILDSAVIKEASYAYASDNYKSVLADPSRNLIGFGMEGWGINEAYSGYRIYQWLDGSFRLALEQVTDDWTGSNTRGMYSGGYLYILSRDGNGYEINQYDMTDDFREAGRLNLEP